MEKYDQDIYYFIFKNSRLNEVTIVGIGLHIVKSLDYMYHIKYVKLWDQPRECLTVW
jgi:hypothetical protein